MIGVGTKKELILRAKDWCELKVETWSPGDRATRYTFWDSDGRQVGTSCLGLKEAWATLYGINAGMRLQVKRTLTLA